MRKALAYIGITAALLGGTVACQPGSGSTNSSQYVDEVQYGYYDAGYSDAAHYHYYAHPKQVRVKRSQYTAHKYEYAPHGAQHTVKVVHHTTTTTTTTKHGKTTVKKTKKTTHHTVTRSKTKTRRR
jgi:hypothetical protein